VFATIRARLLTVLAIVAAIAMWYGIVAPRAHQVRASCTDRGGALVFDLDERGVSLVQWCVLPDGSRQRI
jgi:putative hemolysin